jgi:hypothetical protein
MQHDQKFVMEFPHTSPGTRPDRPSAWALDGRGLAGRPVQHPPTGLASRQALRSAAGYEVGWPVSKEFGNPNVCETRQRRDAAQHLPYTRSQRPKVGRSGGPGVSAGDLTTCCDRNVFDEARAIDTSKCSAAHRRI